MDYRKAYEEWLTNPCFDEATKAELRGSRTMRRRSESGSTESWNSAPRACGASSAREPTV